MPRVCVICKRQQSSSLSVFKFPVSFDHQAAWVRVIRNIYPNFAKSETAIQEHMKNGICEMHFDKKDIQRGKIKCRLKKGALPSVAAIKIQTPLTVNQCRNKCTQTDSMVTLLQSTISDEVVKERVIKMCIICQGDAFERPGCILNDCNKSILQTTIEICLLNEIAYDTEICFRCINIVKEIVHLKNEISHRTNTLRNFVTQSNNNIVTNIPQSKVKSLLARSKLVSPTKTDGVLKKKKSTFTCSLCHKFFYTKHLYLLHDADHKNCYDCVICGRYLTTVARLQQHLFKFHSIGEAKKKSFWCSYCEKAFGTRSGLKYHEIVVHTGSPSIICVNCNKSFKSNLLYKSHLLFAHGEKTVTCDLCPKKFYTISKRNTHTNTVHRSVKTWLCQFCDSKFTSNTALRHHVGFSHNNDAYRCNFCPSVFKKKVSLKNHLLKHNKYTCTECDLLFNNPNTFIAHVTDVHKNKDNVALSNYNSEMSVLDEVNYVESNTIDDGSVDMSMESINLIGIMDKSNSGDDNLSNAMPLVNVHLLHEMDSNEQSMTHTIEPLCEANLFESDIGCIENVVSNENNLPLQQPDQIHTLNLPERNKIDNLLQVTEDKLNNLPLYEGNEIQNLPLPESVRSDPPSLQPTEEIQFHPLQFSEGTNTELPIQPIDDVEISAQLENSELNLSLNESGNSGIDDLQQDDELNLPFVHYHERSLENSLDHKSFETNHLVEIGGETEICSLARDKDWNLPLVLDHSDVQSISFATDNIASDIDIPLCQEENGVVECNTSIESDLSEYTLPVESTDKAQYSVYLNSNVEVE